MSWEWAFLWGAIAGTVGGFLAGMYAALDSMRRDLRDRALASPKRSGGAS